MKGVDMNKTCFCGISEHCGYQIETDMEQHDKVIYEQGYNQAITEFAKRLKIKLGSYYDHYMIDEVAEEMHFSKIVPNECGKIWGNVFDMPQDSEV